MILSIPVQLRSFSLTLLPQPRLTCSATNIHLKPQADSTTFLTTNTDLLHV